MGRSSSSCAILLGGVALSALCCGCWRSEGPRIVSAEFLDEVTPDGAATPDETILLALDRPLPEAYPLERVRVNAVPPVDWTPKVSRTSDPRSLSVSIATGAPAFRFRGTHPQSPGATVLRLDLGDGILQDVDLQIAESLPVLERVVWQDRGEPSAGTPGGRDAGAGEPGEANLYRGNLVVDQGDCLRLIFDRPVALNLPPGESPRVRCPQDVILSKANDRLDDGEIHALFAPGYADREILIVLGSQPVLTIPGPLTAAPGGIDRFQPEAPSGFALDGTRILPVERIVDRRGGRGSISLKEVDIEYEEGFPLPRRHSEAIFPPPGHRIFHTLSPVVGGRAIIVGGAQVDGRQALDQVIVFDPFYDSQRRRDSLRPVQGKLPHPIYHHTATILPGEDRILNTSDDVIVVAGGTDGTRIYDDLVLIRLREDGDLAVETVGEKLRIPRAEHAAVGLPGNRILVDGGRGFRGEAPAGLVGCAEIVSFDFGASPAAVIDHSAIRSIPRMRHTLTLLAPTPDGATYVLVYGGYGQARRRPLEPTSLGQGVESPITSDLFYPTDEGTVLHSPVLLNVDSPTASIWKLRTQYSHSLLRWGHAAVPLDVPATRPSGSRASGASGSGDGPRGSSSPAGAGAVLIVGGSLRHVIHGFDGGPGLWEISLDEAPIELVRSLPEGPETANAILFRFQPAQPEASTLEVMPHPSPDPAQAPERISFAALSVPRRGVFILGGERSGVAGENLCLSSAEVFLQDAEKLAVLAVRLSTSRARHQAYAIDFGGASSLFLVGGAPNPGERSDFSAIEEIPLR